jgi:hypothetical protein
VRRRHRVGSLLVFAPIRAGQEEELRETLAALGENGKSPLAGVPGTHVARFVVFDHLLEDERGWPLDGDPYLLFGSEFDGPVEDHLSALARMPQAKEIWAYCEGVEAGGDPEALRGYLERYRVRPGTSVVAYPHASVADVRRSLDLRNRLAAFVIATRELDPVALREAWLRAFPPTE